jgi:hypothetical protein
MSTVRHGHDVEPTAQHLEAMARALVTRAAELERLAGRLRETQNLEIAPEALNIYAGLVNELRLDLVVSRPVRSLLLARDRQEG